MLKIDRIKICFECFVIEHLCVQISTNIHVLSVTLLYFIPQKQRPICQSECILIKDTKFLWQYHHLFLIAHINTLSYQEYRSQFSEIHTDLRVILCSKKYNLASQTSTFLLHPANTIMILAIHHYICDTIKGISHMSNPIRIGCLVTELWTIYQY